MCGRVRLYSDVSEIKLVFSSPPRRPTPNLAPSWNAASGHSHAANVLDLSVWQSIKKKLCRAASSTPSGSEIYAVRGRYLANYTARKAALGL